MLPDQVSNPGPLTYESGALPIALCGPAHSYGPDTNDEPLTDGWTDGRTDTQNFGGYNIIPHHFSVAGHKNCCKISEIFFINPIALRKAKFVCNFGLSECNRVNFLFKIKGYTYHISVV